MSDLFSPEQEDFRPNVPELTVSDLALGIKRELEQAFGMVRVRGELSKVKLHSSGHLYSDLKDENAVINLVCWRTSLAKLAIRPEEGLDVICTGRITTYPARSNYQLVVESMELAGQGALLKMLADRKARLQAEGIFDPNRKQPIPAFPATIGVITSSTGAVIQDILHRLGDRWPCNVLVWPVRVQGETAAMEVAAAINGFNALPAHIARPDVLIIARGGGSLEDLMPFNEENVVRAVAASTIPTISAVGHETDTTLIDFAADIRAPTPTAAAELAAPRADELAYALNARGQHMTQYIRRQLREQAAHLTAAAAPLRNPERLFELRIQLLDALAARLPASIQQSTRAFRSRIDVLAAQLRHPRELLAVNRDRLAVSGQRMGAAIERELTRLQLQANTLAQRLRRPTDLLAGNADKLAALHARVQPALARQLAQLQAQLDHSGRMLESYSTRSVLARGFALVRDDQGHIVTSSAALQTGNRLNVTLADGGQVDADVVKVRQDGA